MDEEMMQMMAMEQMLGAGGDPMSDPMGGGGDSPPGYTMVYVPDAVLPAVMELVDAVEGGGGAMSAGGMGMDPMAGGMDPMAGGDPMAGMF